MAVQQNSRFTGSALVVAALAAFALAAPATAHAQGAKSAKTAETHASLAEKATDVAMVQKHLHHALNCLEGKDGKDYDAAAGDPCKGAGTDFAAGSADEKQVQAAIKHAKAGESSTELATAQHHAKEAAAALAKIGS